MEFIDRNEELRRLRRLASGQGGFGVIYGRRRIGKSCLLTRWCEECGGVYLVGDTSVASVQRASFAEVLAERFPGFADVVYPTWQSFLRALSERARLLNWHGPVIFDEFPYLVISERALPGIFQAWIDKEAREHGLLVVISGSSRQMMQGLVLEHDSPLYGRAQEILKLAPLGAGYLPKVFGLSNAVDALKAYSIWGGVPRYWEAASSFGNEVDESLEALVFSPLGVFHEEVNFLLQMETPNAMGLRPYLDAVGMGAHRVSEIASRLQQTATSLSRPLGQLIELGLLRRDIPFGEDEKSSKRSLYVISDPFCHFWFRIVAPRRSLFEGSTPELRRRLWHKWSNDIYAFQWEDLARRMVSRLPQLAEKLPSDDGWLPARRWWRENHPEWDVVSVNSTGEIVLLGEVKWSEKPFDENEIRALAHEMLLRDPPIGLPSRKVYALFVPSVAPGVRIPEDICLVTGQELLDATLDGLQIE